jgi:hypothetical protein
MKAPEIGTKVIFRSATWPECPRNGEVATVQDPEEFSTGPNDVLLAFDSDFRKIWCTVEECEPIANDTDFPAIEFAGEFDFIKANTGSVLKEPCILLLGPSSDGDNWQMHAIKTLRQKTNVCIATTLRRDAQNRNDFQEDWIVKHMRYAAGEGCIAFWFPKKIAGNPESAKIPMQSIFLLGQICGLTRYSDACILIGIEEGSDLEILKGYISELNPLVMRPFYTNLDQLCEAVLALPSIVQQ